MANSAEIRARLATELRLDLIGPSYRDTALVNEVLPDPPSRWYLTGFLVPVDTPSRRKARDPQEEMDTAEQAGADDDETPDRGASNPRSLPSSMGLSLLVEPKTQALRVTCRWGEYHREESERDGGRKEVHWRREQRVVTCDVPLRAGPPIVLGDTDGLEIARHVRPTQVRDETGSRNVVAVSLFLVNRRTPSTDEFEDKATAFQAEIEIDIPASIVARSDLSGLDTSDDDARIADLHYRDVVDWAVGHNVSIEAEGDAENGKCRYIRTCWLPTTFVPRLVPGDIAGVELGMEALADAAAARNALETSQSFIATGSISSKHAYPVCPLAGGRLQPHCWPRLAAAPSASRTASRCWRMPGFSTRFG